MKSLSAILLLSGIISRASLLCAEPSLMPQVWKMVSESASDAGFSDEDALKVSVFFMEKLIGPVPEGQKLVTRIEGSEPEGVRVFVAYDFGLKFTGFEFEYRRGNVQKGMRWAQFVRLSHVPSE
jgi:hypothetical protein